jgi:hypothetical protein
MVRKERRRSSARPWYYDSKIRMNVRPAVGGTSIRIIFYELLPILNKKSILVGKLEGWQVRRFKADPFDLTSFTLP